MIGFGFGAIVIIISLILGVGGLFLIRLKVPKDVLQSNHEVASVMLGMVGTLYAVLLGLVVVDALSKYETAHATESAEANSLATIMHVALTLPEKDRQRIIRASANYVEEVVNEEWDALATKKAPTSKAVLAFVQLWLDIGCFDPRTPREENLHNTMLSAVQQLGDSRRARIAFSQEGLPPLLWGVLIFGGMFTVAFTYFFASANLILQASMTALVVVLLAMNILLVAFFGNPYQGEFKLQPQALIHVQKILRASDAGQPNFQIPSASESLQNSASSAIPSVLPKDASKLIDIPKVPFVP